MATEFHLLAAFRGIGLKIIGLAVVPVVIITALVFVVQARLGGVFEETLRAIELNDTESRDLNQRIDSIQGDMSIVLGAIAHFMARHNKALLSGNAGLVAGIRENRDVATAAVSEFRHNVSDLFDNVKGLDIYQGDRDKARQLRRKAHLVNRMSIVLTNLMTLVVESNERTLALIKNGDKASASSNFTFEESARIDAVSDALTKARDGLAGLNALIGEELHARRVLVGEQAFEDLNGTRSLSTVLALAMMAIIVVLGFFYAAFGLVRPIGRMTEDMTRLAEGDFSVDVPTTLKDQLRDMANALRVFKDNGLENRRLQDERTMAEEQANKERKASRDKMAADLENRFKGAMDVIGASVERLRDAAGTMLANADHTSGQSTAVSAVTEQASASVNNVSASTTELSSSTQEIASQVSRASATASEAVAKAEATNERIQKLADTSQKIGDVVTLINDIAAQTNLLALNATIEAARAGDAGKGFAVVASEVKNLAGQTARATDEIASQINAIQDGTREAVDAIASIQSVINNVSEISTSIASAVEEQSAATDEIARSAEQAADGTRETSEIVTTVAEAARETGDVARQVSTLLDTLSQESQHLKDELERFLREIRAN